MSTVLLVRHGLIDTTGRVLSGWTPDLHLDERGRRQAAAVAERLRTIPLAAVVSSPVERCRETAEAILAGRELGLTVDERIGEVRYGDWTGRELRSLAKEPLWRVVQAHPSAAEFPGGESLRAMQARAVEAIRDWDARLGEDAVWVACSHGDPIRAIVSDALGAHLDQFQRIVVDPCSVTAIRYTRLRPFVLRVNDTGGSLSDLVPKKRRTRRRTSDAVVGGGSGGLE